MTFDNNFFIICTTHNRSQPNYSEYRRFLFLYASLFTLLFTLLFTILQIVQKRVTKLLLWHFDYMSWGRGDY